MARRTKVWTADYGRDRGKQFLLTELPADAAERWATRAFLAMTNANIEVPDGALQSGMAGIAATLAAGVRALAGLKYDAVGPLMDEMLSCVQFVAPGTAQPQPLWTGENSQIEEVRTRLALRVEVLELHLGFSLAALASSTPETSGTTPVAAQA